MWDLFSRSFAPGELWKGLESSSIFARGLPPKEDLQDPAVAGIFFRVLSDLSICRSDVTNTEDEQALDRCFRCGWLHSDRLQDSTDILYTFSSRLHHLFVEMMLSDTMPTTISEPNNILDFVCEVITGFSPYSLSVRPIGPTFIQRPPEAQYQDEFYRSCHNRWKGLLRTFSEFGTKAGRIDFYIPSKQWGVELLREGVGMEQHSERFSKEGRYGRSLPLSDYIMLDCRSTTPTRPHTSMCI
jgi:hypothetical protein